MIDKRFSGPMSPPTEFEQKLLDARSDEDADPWVRLGRKIGAVALCEVLAEFGGTRAHVPARREFFPRLYRTERNQRLAELDATGKMTAGEIGQVLQMRPGAVRRVRQKVRRAAARRGTGNRDT